MNYVEIFGFILYQIRKFEYMYYLYCIYGGEKAPSSMNKINLYQDVFQTDLLLLSNYCILFITLENYIQHA